VKNAQHRPQHSQRGVIVAVSALVVLLAALGRCGGEGVEAPFTPYGERCPDVDDYLSPLLGLASEGRLPNVSAVFSEDLSEGERDEAVGLVFALADSLDLGAINVLEQAGGDSGGVRALEERVAALTYWLGEGGPEAPYLEVVGRLTVALDTPSCEGEPLFALLSELLVQEGFVLAVLAASADPTLDIDQLLEDLVGPDDDPRSGLREFVRNLLMTALAPNFDVQEWTGLLGLILDVDAPPWSSLIAELEAFFVSGPHLTSLQSLLHCLHVSDPELTTSDLLYDVLTAPPEGATFSGEDGATVSEILSTLKAPLMALLAIFQGDAKARSTLAMLSAAMVAPARVEGVLSDLTLLFDAGVLIPVLDVLRAVSTRSCAP
jgi:hypothetical protein